jgi:hypothetical protein
LGDIVTAENPYKQAWLETCGHGIIVRTTSNNSQNVSRNRYKRKRDLLVPTVKMVQRQAVEQMVLAAAHQASLAASQSVVLTTRLAGKVGLRLVPVISAAILAKDIYDVYQVLTKD